MRPQRRRDHAVERHLVRCSTGGAVVDLVGPLGGLLAGRIGRGLEARRRFLAPYVACALALVACAALRPGDGSALEAGLTVGLAPLGYAWAVTRPSLAQGDAGRLARSWPWIGAAVAGLVIYGAVFGPGVG